MRVEVHVFLHAGDSLAEHLHELLHEINREGIRMSEATDRLKATVAEQTTTVDRVVALIRGFPEVVTEAVRKALEDAGVDTTGIDALVSEADASIRENTQELETALMSAENPPDPEPSEFL